MGCEGGWLKGRVYGKLLLQQCGHRLEGYPHVDVLTIGDATLYATAVVGGCTRLGIVGVAGGQENVVLL